jgi:hypothetical protein
MCSLQIGPSILTSLLELQFEHALDRCHCLFRVYNGRDTSGGGGSNGVSNGHDEGEEHELVHIRIHSLPR